MMKRKTRVITRWKTPKDSFEIILKELKELKLVQISVVPEIDNIINIISDIVKKYNGISNNES